MHAKEAREARIEGLAIGFALANRYDGVRLYEEDVAEHFAPVTIPGEAILESIARELRRDAIEAVCDRYSAIQRCTERTYTAERFYEWRRATRCWACDRWASVAALGQLYASCAEHSTRAEREREEREADPRPGFYYVSAQDGPRSVLVRGPYTSHVEALRAVDATRTEAERVDPRAIWYAWGTARSETDLGPGALDRA